MDRSKNAPFTLDAAKVFAQESSKLMRRTQRSFKEIEAELRTVVIDEEEILNRVAIDREVAVHEALQDPDQETNTNNGSLFKTAATLYNITKDVKRADEDKNVEE